jgi:hypothetical protein
MSQAQARERLEARRPIRVPPRTVTGPTLLTGLALRDPGRGHDDPRRQGRAVSLRHLHQPGDRGRHILQGPEHPMEMLQGDMCQLVSRVEVEDRQIWVSGPESTLAERMLDSASAAAAAAAGVPSFVQGWWARQDSNLRQHRYERRVLTS